MAEVGEDERERRPDRRPSGDPELLAALDAAERTDTALRALLRDLAEAPAQYAGQRVTLDRLHAERRTALAAVGEIVLKRSREAPPPVIEPAVPAVESIESETTSSLDPEPSALPDAAQDSPQLSEDANDSDAGVPSALHSETRTTSSENQPLTPDELRARLAVLRLPQATAPRAAGDDRSLLRRIIGPFAEPPDVSTSDRAIGEIDELDNATSEEAVARWVRFRQPTQRLLLGMFVARVRALQEAPTTPRSSLGVLNVIFARLREFIRAEQPGVVYGYARGHEPRGASWSDDADEAYGELEAVAGLVRRGPSAPGDSDTSSEDDVRDEDVAESEPEDELSSDWPYWSQVRGRTAVLFGGAPREERRGALERALRLAKLDWVEGGRPREAESLITRVRNGSVDLLFITKFASHKDSDRLIDAARATGTPYFVLRHGYGIAAMRSAIELVAGQARVGSDGGRL